MNDFCQLLETQIPRLRRYARALTRDVVRADDLVQSCLARAIAKQHLWQPGTDLPAWLFTMAHHLHVSDLRRSAGDRNTVSIDDVNPMWGVKPDPLHGRELRDLQAALAKLAIEQRQARLPVGPE